MKYKAVLIFLLLALLASSLQAKVFYRGYNSKQVALTFDDGPNAYVTAQILDILRKENVPATFFVVGKNWIKLLFC